MAFLAWRVHVRTTSDYSYRENGIAFVVIFEGVETNLNECQILSGDETPLTGVEPQYSVTTLQPYGVNRSWEAIPLEFLVADG